MLNEGSGVERVEEASRWCRDERTKVKSFEGVKKCVYAKSESKLEKEGSTVWDSALSAPSSWRPMTTIRLTNLGEW